MPGKPKCLPDPGVIQKTYVYALMALMTWYTEMGMVTYMYVNPYARNFSS